MCSIWEVDLLLLSLFMVYSCYGASHLAYPLTVSFFPLSSLIPWLALGTEKGDERGYGVVSCPDPFRRIDISERVWA